MKIDKRFALVRDGTLWYATEIGETFRVTERGKTRDAFDQALATNDISEVARLVLKEGRRMRCAPEGVKVANSLDLQSRGVSGYVLDTEIAAYLEVPPRI